MRVINQNMQTITEFDLTKGSLRTMKVIRPDAISLGTEIVVQRNGKPVKEKKTVWATEDYEEVQMYIPYREKSPQEKITELKRKLSTTDYKVIKCSECQLLGEEFPYDMTELHAERQAIRDEINILEKMLDCI